jgi:DNA polymerase-4
MDECWLDVTASQAVRGHAVVMAQRIRSAVREELGLTVSIGVSFNKIFAKLGSDYKKPDAITTMYQDEFKSKAWKLPASDLLYVGRSTNQKLCRLGIKTIGDLAETDESILQSQLGKMGSILWAFANGYDDSPVKVENTRAPIKSVGNSTTTPRDLENDEDVKIVLYILAESVATRLRENGFKCRVVEISVRDNELLSFTRQHKISNATNITKEIAEEAYRIFKESYNWRKPIRSLGVRGADLVNDNYWEQIDLFSSVELREKQEKMDQTVDDIRRRFGFYSVQRGLMYRDRILSAVNAKEDHTVHPHGYFG